MDFPINFSETAARRLQSIAQNGPRCGVYTFVVVDTEKNPPYGFSLEELERVCEETLGKWCQVLTCDITIIILCLRLFFSHLCHMSRPDTVGTQFIAVDITVIFQSFSVAVSSSFKNGHMQFILNIFFLRKCFTSLGNI